MGRADARDERLLALPRSRGCVHPDDAAKLIARVARREMRPRLAQGLGEVVPEARATLIDALATLGDRSVIPALRGAMDGAPEDTAAHAVTAIAMLGGAKALEPLLDAALDPRAGVRKTALEALASLSPETLRSSPRTVEVAEKVIAAPEDQGQVKAIAVLARHGGRAAAAASRVRSPRRRKACSAPRRQRSPRSATPPACRCSRAFERTESLE